ncbi:hypothetical protein SAMN05428989_3741 [Pseudoxanthomonas sp. GM95]|uniref:hypothetical protein n=1 Tax=Pseudoxanthomonas sp. GM95 TaxID=1881043 RepID=UPI0008B35229|nr:hypothetical protein [Pseudoxanthomonas sp. GM95]SEM39875.1 hypothetical protein SAMN05428989_3741 [Pseudoxanthomonas sp. GM95]
MKRAQGIALGVLACAGIAAGVWWWQRGQAPSAAPVVATGVAVAPAVSAPKVASLGAAQTPLPDDGTPLRLVFDGLKQRANGGDARAACRLAAELEKCERVRTQLAQFDDQLGFQQERMERETDPQQRARMQQGMDRFTGGRGQQLLQDSEQCDGAPYVSPAERATLWRAAALGGSLPALTQYAVGNAFRTRDTLDLLPQLQVYRNEAESLALQAAQRGSLKATLALAAAYSPNRDTGRRTYLAQVVNSDAGKSLAFYLQAQSAFTAQGNASGTPPMRLGFVNRNIDALRKTLSADQIAQAEAQAGQLKQGWTAQDTTGGSFSPDGGTSDIEPQACSD